MPQEVNPRIHVSDFDFPHEPYHCDDPEKKKLVIKLAKLITDNIPRKLPGGMHENHMDFWILDRLLTKDEVKFQGAPSRPGHHLARAPERHER